MPKTPNLAPMGSDPFRLRVPLVEVLGGNWGRVAHTGVSRRGFLACLGLVCLGCASKEQEMVEIKQISDGISLTELEWFLKIVDWLPGKKLPFFPSPLVPPENWLEQDQKSIERLTQERIDETGKRWSVNQLAIFLDRNRAVRWALQRAEGQSAVFAGLILTLGAALSRSSLVSDQDLLKLEAKAKGEVDRLLDEKRSLVKLKEISPETFYHITHAAMWIPLWDLLTHLNQVPEENLNLVTKHRNRLEQAFPEEFHENLLKRYTKILNATGLPFEELPGHEGDDLDVWNPETPSQSAPAPGSGPNTTAETFDLNFSDLGLPSTTPEIENAQNPRPTTRQ